MAAQYVYLFTQLADVEKKIGNKWDDIKGFLGGKGAGLARMTALGLPVPAGFTISTEACKFYLASKDSSFPPALWEQVLTGLKAVEEQTGKKFNDEHKPLFVSCRSGAKFSMPGMMDTVLNIGLNDKSAVALAKLTSERFVMDAYRRLISGFGSIVLNIPAEVFEHALAAYKKSKNYKSDMDMAADDWKALIVEFKAITKKEKGIDFPQEPLEQLRMSIGAVFGSWNSKRAIAYREKMNIAHDLGTACSIVTMVFGNMGDDSATGVAFTRSPSTGEKKFYGEYLKNAQGEDVVAGIRNTTPVADMAKEFPECFQELLRIAAALESFFKNMQDIEFTIEKKKLYMLQCRDGKRTAKSQVKIAIDMVAENLISKEEAVKRVSPDDVNILLLPQLDAKELEVATKEGRQIAKGVNASPGGAVGKVYFEADVAVEKSKQGEAVVLVRPFTKPEDVHGFFASKGVLTAEGGATSHAAVVARQFGLPCIAGASAINVDMKAKLFTVQVGDKTVTVHEGEYISLDATHGYVYAGKVNTVAADFNKEIELKTILEWADEICAQPCREKGTRAGLQVWANADYGRDAVRARAYGAKGLGLCRTEHMFFETERLPIVQKMILSKNPEEKQQYLDKLEPVQQKDFEDLFRAMTGLPVIIRLIDPPLHEFLPDEQKLKAAIHKAELAKAVEMAKPSADHANVIKTLEAEIATQSTLLKSVEEFHEANPMIGLRGCRLGVVYPAIMTMQAKAIFQAACVVKKEGLEPVVEVMVPLTVNIKELEYIQPLIVKGYEAAAKKYGVDFHWKYGTMIETPRAALVAGDLAKLAQFFSFGTNDLTQMTFGVSRDDAEKSFLVDYVTKGIIPHNPFQTLDKDGVGLLIKEAVKAGRAVQGAHMNIGVCGEVGGDPTSIESFHAFNLTYVSCSPFRVPVARLAAAHAALAAGKQ